MRKITVPAQRRVGADAKVHGHPERIFGGAVRQKGKPKKAKLGTAKGNLTLKQG